MSPLEILKGRKVDLAHIRVFGSTCFVHIKRHDKLDKNSVKAIFLGYPSEKKGYKCYDPTNFKVYFSRDVAFFENTPYYQTDSASQPFVLQPHNFTFSEDICQDQVEDVHTLVPSAIPSGGANEESQEKITLDTNEGTSQEEPTIRRSTRQTRQPIQLRDYVSHQVMYPIQNYISYKKVTPEYRAYLGNIAHQTEPSTWAEAKEHPVWQKAMNEELQALEKKSYLGYYLSTKRKETCRM
jgi:hypothetical protein